MDSITELDYILKSSIIIAAIYVFFSVDRVLAYLIHFKRMQSSRRQIHQSTLDAVMHNFTQRKDVSKVGEVAEPRNDANNNESIEATDVQQLEEEKNQFKNELEVAIVSNALTRTDSIRSRKSNVSLQKGAREEKISHAQDDKLSVCVDIVERVVIDTAQLEVATVAYMIIFGSSANNFVDGMSTGAAFSLSFSKGLSIGIAVIAQEFPQEVGTLAILIKSGLGFKRTILLNLIPNMLSFLGFITGVVVGGTDDSYEMYIFSISSGMYLYIFLGTLIPEIRDSVNELIKTDLNESILSTVLQALGIAVGVTFMYVMCTYGHKIQV
uniref:Uncharacterized protein n=1 Tax=Parascaris univalens TaxID=6257 RepID=A0A914ZJE6_PARUN